MGTRKKKKAIEKIGKSKQIQMRCTDRTIISVGKLHELGYPYFKLTR